MCFPLNFSLITNVSSLVHMECESGRSNLSFIPSVLKQKNEHGSSAASLESDNSSNASPATSGSHLAQMDSSVDLKGRRKSVSRRVDEVAPVDPFFEPTQAGELFSATVRGRRPPPVSWFGRLEISLKEYLLNIYQVKCEHLSAYEVLCHPET